MCYNYQQHAGLIFGIALIMALGLSLASCSGPETNKDTDPGNARRSINKPYSVFGNDADSDGYFERYPEAVR